MAANSLLVAIAVAAAVAGSWFIRALYVAHFGPLSKIPGPELNRWSDWPLRFAVLGGQRIFFVDNLHRKYGPVVRLSTTEVAIADAESVKEIHKITGGFLKSNWYLELTQEKVPGIFAMTDPKAHAARRKLFGRVFSQTSLNDWEPLLRSRAQMAVSGIKNQAKNGSVNILAWWTFMATDVIGEMGFGESFKALEAGKKTDYLHDVESALIVSGIQNELPYLVAILYWIPIRSVQHFLQSNKRLEQYGTVSIRRNKALREQGKEAPGTLFSKMIGQGEENTLTDYEVEREAANLIVAGSDTTAVTLTYLIWATMTHPEVRARLMDELNSLREDFSNDDVQNLKYLNMVTQESLRLYGAAPGGLPRVVPKGGRFLGGHFLAEGCVVSTQAYTAHRNAEIFPQPLEFIPERWQNPTAQMKDAFMPFGAGTRVCLGIHLARMELGIATALFFRQCPTAQLAPSMTATDMEFLNYFLISPKSKKCEIVIPA